MAVYNLGSSPDYHWLASAGGFGSTFPYIPTFTSDSVGVGSQVTFMDADHFFAATNGGQVIPYTLSNGSWSQQPPLNVSGLAQTDTLAASGGLVLTGSPGAGSGVGDAELSDGLTLLPYGVNLGTFGFGYGPVIASSGHYLVGNSQGTLFSFRQIGPGWAPLANDSLMVPNPPPTAKLGSSVAIDGMLTVIGAPQYDNRGAAFVFTIANGSTAGTYTWTYAAMLQSDDAREGDLFGASVGISGTTVIVGAPGRSNGTGAVYMFQEIGSRWVQEGAAIVPGDAGTGYRVGASVAINGSLALVGAPGANAAYVIEGSGTGWTIIGELDGAGGFGTSVALNGQLAVVGAPTDNGGTGAFYAYQVNGSGVLALVGGAITAMDGARGDLFGQSVAVSGSYAVIGAPGVDNGQGAAYVFLDSAGTWSPVQELSVLPNPDNVGPPNDSFGSSVAISGQRIVVGAPLRDVTTTSLGISTTAQDEGAAFVYGLADGQWSLETVVSPLTGSDAAAGDNVGYSVAVSGDMVVAGAPQLAGRTPYNGTPGVINTSGAGYAYLRSVSPPTTVTYPEAQQTIIDGAQANTISGTIGGLPMSTVKFFDVSSFIITTGSAASTVTIGPAGLTAYGLASFTVNAGSADTTLVLQSPNLTPPLVGQYLPTGDFNGAPSGSALPPGAGYMQVTGAFTFNGTGSNAVVASADTDWTLNGTTLTSGAGGSVALNGVQSVQLIGGPSANRITVVRWAGQVTIDGGGGSDVVTVYAAGVADWTVNETAAGPADQNQLTVIGGSADNAFIVTASQIYLGTVGSSYSGIQVLKIVGGPGNDSMTIDGTSASVVYLDGGAGSDTYIIAGTGSFDVWVSDSGPGPAQGDTDTLRIPGNSSAQSPVNGFFHLVAGSTTIYYDRSIEKVEQNAVPPILTVQGTPGDDTFTVNGSILTFNSIVIDLTTVTQLTIDGNGGNDTVTVLGVLPTLTSFVINGGNGTTTLVGPNGPTTWTITDQGIGTVGVGNSAGGSLAVSFTNVQNLSGGIGSNTFTFVGDSAGIAGNLEGGGGQNVITWSGRASGVTVDLATGTATGVGGTVSDVQTFIAAGSGNTLVGPDADAAWTINAANSGTVLVGSSSFTFEGFQNLTGGAGSDSFDLVSGGSVSGIVDGGAGTNFLTIDASQPGQIIDITGSQVGVDGAATGYADIQVLSINATSGSDLIGIDPSGAGFPSAVNLATSGMADTITVVLAPSATTAINVNAGSLSSDTLVIQGASTPDPVLVTDSLVQFDSMQVTFTNIENLTVNGAAGNDSITLTGPIVPGTLTVNAGTGDVTVNVGSFALGSGGTAGGIASQLILNGGPGNDVLNIDDSGDTVATDVQLTSTALAGLGSIIQYSGFATVNVSFGSAVSNLVIASTDSGATNVFAGSGPATETILSTGGQLTLATGDGNDTVNVQAIGAPAVITLGAGNDTVNVGTQAPGLGSVVSGIGSELTVIGGSGTGNLFIDDSSDTAPSTGTLTNSTIAGLGMAGGITYQGIAGLTITLGSGGNTFAVLSNDTQVTTILGGEGNNTFTIAATAGAAASASGPLFLSTGNGTDSVTIFSTTGPVIVTAGNGDDTVNVQSIGAPATITLGSGTDTVTVGSLAPVTGGVAGGISALLTVNGGAGMDTLIIDDSGDTAPQSLVLGADHVGGLGMAAGIDFTSIADLVLLLGSGVTDITIIGTPSGTTTTLTLGPGNDTVNIQATEGPLVVVTGAGSDTINISSDAPANQGTLAGIQGEVTIDAAQGAATLNVSDAGDALPSDVLITATSITGLSPAPITYITSGGSFSGGINISAGSGGNVVLIQSTNHDPGTTTTVWSGNGSDSVTVTDTDPTSLVINGQEGNDLIDASAATTGVTITDGNGNDIILGGSGNDTITAGNGNDEIIGGLGSNTITAGNGNDIIIGSDGEVVRVGGQVVLVESTNGTQGGDNVITAGSGNDVIIGGPGNNTITANGGQATQDIVLGHNGYVTFGGTAPFGPGEAASTISFNFIDSSRTFVTGVFGASGAAAGDWNNLDGSSGTYGATPDQSVLLSNGDTAPGVTVQWTSGQGQAVTGVTVSGLSYYYASYDLYVYIQGGGADGHGASLSQSISDGTLTYYLTDTQGRTFRGTLVQVTSTDPNAPGVGNYVVFQGLSGNSFTLSVAGTSPAGCGFRDDPFGIAGLQIVGQSQPIDRIATTYPTVGGNDTITLAGGSNIVFGGAGNNVISIGGAGNNIVAGSNAEATLVMGSVRSVQTTDPEVGGNDVITTGAGADVILGGSGNDILSAGAGNNVVFADNAEVTFFPGGQLGIQLLFPAYGGTDTVVVGSGTNLFFDQAGSVTYVFPAGVGGSDTIVEAGTPDCAGQAPRHDTFDFSGFGAPLAVSYSATQTRIVGGSSATSPQLAVSVSNPLSIEQVITTAQDQILLGFFDVDALTGHGKAQPGRDDPHHDDAHHDDDASLAVIVNAGAGDDLLTVARVGHDDTAITGGGTSSTPWSVGVEDPELVVINTADAGAVVKTGCPRGDAEGVIVNRGAAAMNPPPAQPDQDGHGCDDSHGPADYSCDFNDLTFTVTGFGTPTMSLLTDADADHGDFGQD